MNPKKICFILCSNDKFLAGECELYIRQLLIPDGYEVDVIIVEEADSMCAGYNEGMAASDAKYKVYLHQDVLIINKNFMNEMLGLFQKNPQIGMFGVVGNTSLAPDGGAWSDGMHRRIGEVYIDLVYKKSESVFAKIPGEYQEALVLDGLLMATQYDLPWREGRFQGWDFYDCSQSLEFWKAGYKVVVPHMEQPWCLHDNDILNMVNYDRWRQVFLEEYGDVLPLSEEGRFLEAVSGHNKRGTKKKTGNRKFSFIMCSNNDLFRTECERYISDLEIPEGYEADVICIQDAVSMTAGYNAAMNASDAKYKIYLHHDTFLQNRRMLYDILRIFEDPQVGMIGMLGAEKLPPDANCAPCWDVGTVLAYGRMRTMQITSGRHCFHGRRTVPVRAVDGLLMITQYDLPWREDVFDGWDFYDVSQCMEMQKHGYRVVIPSQEQPWCYHDCGPSKMKAYDHYRRIAIREYPDEFCREVDEAVSDNKQEEYRKEDALAEFMWREWLEGNFKELAMFTEQFHGEYPGNNFQLQILLFLVNVYKKEQKHSEIFAICDWEELFRYFKRLCFVLRRLLVHPEDERFANIFRKWLEKKISTELLEAVADSLSLDFSVVHERLMALSYAEVNQCACNHPGLEI